MMPILPPPPDNAAPEGPAGAAESTGAVTTGGGMPGQLGDTATGRSRTDTGTMGRGGPGSRDGNFNLGELLRPTGGGNPFQTGGGKGGN